MPNHDGSHTDTTPLSRLLGGERIDVWSLDPESVPETVVHQAKEAILDTGELSRCERFRFARHRHLFATAHLLVRLALSQYCDTPPAAWRFSLNQYGHPRIHDHELADTLKFNLSHTNGRAVVAVGCTAMLGVDIERLDRRVNLGVAERFFSPQEIRGLSNLPDDRRRKTRFLELWTLKEAYIKARGMGLALPLRHFSLVGFDETHPRVEFDEAINDDPRLWYFDRFTADDEYLIAVACRGTAQRPEIARIDRRLL